MHCRQWLLSFFFLHLVVSISPAQAPKRPQPKPRPNVILITLDTTRADRMGFLGSDRGVTPNLDVLAKQATVFTRAYSQVPHTTASHATILTGTYPQFNHVHDFGSPLAADLPYLPDILHHQGYQTAAFVGSIVLDPGGGLAPGFDRGFDVYDAGFHNRQPGESRYESVERRAGDVVAHAQEWLNHRRSKSRPFFLWVHVYDPHDPYDAPQPYKSRASDPYDGEIVYTDAMVGKLLGALRSAGLYDGSLVAVMADHGEAFGEHDERSHGIFLYDETIHVPLVIKLPGKGASAIQQWIDARVGLVDVAPTILQATGMRVPEQIQGNSLFSWIRPAKTDPPDIDRLVYSENDYSNRAFGWSSLRALRVGKYLYVEAPKRELYDQNSDPSTGQNIAESASAIADTLNSQLEAFRKDTASGSTAGPTKLDPKQAAKLSALGYVASDVRTSPEGRIGGIDPKDRIAIANSFHDGLLDIEENRFDDAVAQLERVVQSEPSSELAYHGLAAALIKLRQFEKALPVLQKAVELAPDSGILQYRLGVVLYETGNVKDSVAHFELAVRAVPDWVDARYSLATVYLRTELPAEALREVDRALEVDPTYYRANLMRGILLVEDNPTEALKSLQKAAAEEPDASEPHQYMAQAYEKLGNAAKAATQRSLAERQTPQ
jgi:arylsulfatase A-like enzyme/Tfp pilus assembly protein PilF